MVRQQVSAFRQQGPVVNAKLGCISSLGERLSILNPVEKVWQSGKWGEAIFAPLVPALGKPQRFFYLNKIKL